MITCITGIVVYYMKVVRQPLLSFVVKSQMNNLVKFNSRKKKHVIMLIKMAGYRHFPHVKGFKASLNVSVSGLGVSIFMSFQQTRRSGSTEEDVHLYRTKQIIISAHALQCFDGYSRRGYTFSCRTDFLCRQTHSSCQYAGADCDPTPSQIWLESHEAPGLFSKIPHLNHMRDTFLPNTKCACDVAQSRHVQLRQLFANKG